MVPAGCLGYIEETLINTWALSVQKKKHIKRISGPRQNFMGDVLAVILPSRGLLFSETLEELLAELEGFNYRIYWAHGKSLPDCFNEPTERALADKDVFALLICEDDMIIPKGALKAMFAEQYPVVALDYPFQQDGDSTCLHDPDGFAYWTGTGFMLIAKQVLQQMEKPIWRTDTTFDPFIDKDTIHFWPRKLDKVYYGLHDLRFGLVLYSAGMPIKVPEFTAGQRKLDWLGEKGVNDGKHDIAELTVVGRDVVSGMVDQNNVQMFLGAMNRVKNVKIWDKKPPFISYDETNQPYLNDGRQFERVR